MEKIKENSEEYVIDVLQLLKALWKRAYLIILSGVLVAAIALSYTMFFVTPKYLGALFKKNTGNSFHHYLNMMRLKCACSLLKTTNMSVKDAALTSGYNSIEHFIYTFKKHLSVSPTAYRKNKYDFTPLISRNSK